MQSDDNSRMYGGHRKRQQKRILSVAEQLFSRNGISNIGLNDIADVAGVTRATIYRYYANKLEIAWAVYKRYASHIFDTMPPIIWDVQLNGATRLNALLNGFCDYFFTYPQNARFISEFNRIYADNHEVAQIRLNNPLSQNGDDPLTILVEVGVRDGSLRPALDPKLIRTMTLTVLYGMEQRMLQYGEEITREYMYSLLEIYRCAIDVLMQGMRNSATAA
jgi:AcrR family transcriptional regulator